MRLGTHFLVRFRLRQKILEATILIESASACRSFCLRSSYDKNGFAHALLDPDKILSRLKAAIPPLGRRIFSFASVYAKKFWRRRPESNRCARFCRPLPNRLATSPKSKTLKVGIVAITLCRVS